jgi:nucleoside-diphosphate-sugar epimerase
VKKRLVTGSNGFLGVALVERLLARKTPGLRLLVRPGSERRRLDAVLAKYPDAGVEIVSGSLGSPEEAARLLDDVSVIYHLAAALSGQAAEMFLGTVVSSKNLLEAVARREQKPKVLLVSSFGVYGVADLPKGHVLDEETPLEPHPERRDHYSHAKLKQERLFEDYRKKHGIPVAILRPGVIYGPGGGAMSARVGLRLPGMFLFLGGKNLLPLSYVDNCAEAICVAADRARFDGDAYNVLDDELVTCGDYLRRYQKEVERLRVLPMPFPVAMALSAGVAWYHGFSKGQLPAILTPYKTRTSWKGNRFTNERLKGLGFSPIVSTEEGLKRTFAYLRERAAGGAA